MPTYFDAVNDALERLDDLGYERNLGGGDLANHGPMGAETLATLGHGDAIPQWVTVYRNAAPHHEPPVPHQRINGDDESDWRSALGDLSRAGDFEELFITEFTEHGWQATLTRWWPRLLVGPLTGLTHGLIRTVHAVRSITAASHPTAAQLRELARGMGYWASRLLPAPGQARLRGELSVADAVAAIRRVPEPPSSRDAAMQYMRHPDHFPGYHGALESLAPIRWDALLSDMTAEFAGLCVAQDRGWFPIPLVHGVTAPAAARLALPYLPAELHEPTVAALWQAQVALTMLSTRDSHGEADSLRRAAEANVPSWDTLVARAVEHGDEHVIKFTEACLREHCLRPDPRFAWAVDTAQRRVERPDSLGGSAVGVRFANVD